MANAKQWKNPNRRLSASQTSWLINKTKSMISEGLLSIHSSEPSMSSPIQLVRKGDDWRLTIDYKDTVNAAMVNDPYPIPIIMDSLQQAAKFKYFIKVDLSNAYWQVHTSDPKTRELLAFYFHSIGYVSWNVLPQGLKQAPSIFQRFIDSIREKKNIDAPGLFDDFIVGGMTAAECSANWLKLKGALHKYNLKINTDKSILWPQTSIPALGCQLSHNSITPADDYISSLVNFTVLPTDRKSLRKFLGKLAHIFRLYPFLLPGRTTLFANLNRDKSSPSWRLDPSSIS
jgi:hypothetical protein